MLILAVFPPRSFILMLLVGLVVGGVAAFWSYTSLDGVYALGVAVLILSFAVVLGWNTKPVLETEIQILREGDPRPETKPETKSVEEPNARPEPDKPYEVEDIPGVLTMIELPGGTFEMGSDENDREKPVHPVKVSDFAISKTPVTMGLYSRVMDENKNPDLDVKKNSLPKSDVSWFDAIDFCNALSEKQNLSPAYKKTGKTVDWDPEADGYRLPTEAEWEYACRAGNKTRWFFGDDPKELSKYAWYGKDYKEGPYPVASKLPNSWGLYDMAGNVSEWCWDLYGKYDSEASENPAGLQYGNARSLRGGSYFSSAERLRSAYRVRIRPVSEDRIIGFRCVRAPPTLNIE